MSVPVAAPAGVSRCTSVSPPTASRSQTVTPGASRLVVNNASRPPPSGSAATDSSVRPPKSSRAAAASGSAAGPVRQSVAPASGPITTSAGEPPRVTGTSRPAAGIAAGAVKGNASSAASPPVLIRTPPCCPVTETRQGPAAVSTSARSSISVGRPGLPARTRRAPPRS